MFPSKQNLQIPCRHQSSFPKDNFGELELVFIHLTGEIGTDWSHPASTRVWGNGILGRKDTGTVFFGTYLGQLASNSPKVKRGCLLTAPLLMISLTKYSPPCTRMCVCHSGEDNEDDRNAFPFRLVQSMILLYLHYELL